MKNLDKKSKIIIILLVILIAILGAIIYVSYFEEPEMESINLNNVSVSVPKKVDFTMSDENYKFLNSTKGYFVAEFDLNTTNLDSIKNTFHIKDDKLLTQDKTDDGGDYYIYESDDDVKVIGVYINGNVCVVIGAPNTHVLEMMLNGINVFSSIQMPSVETSSSSSSGVYYSSSSNDEEDYSSSSDDFFNSLNDFFYEQSDTSGSQSDSDSLITTEESE